MAHNGTLCHCLAHTKCDIVIIEERMKIANFLPLFRERSTKCGGPFLVKINELK